MTITFSTERFCDIWQELQPLLYRHWDEIASKEISGDLDINENVYRQLELAGALHITVARKAKTAKGTAAPEEGNAAGAAPGSIVGYAAYFIAPNLHYRRLLLAEPDVFFLAPEYRRGMTGVRLLKAAEAALLLRGVTTILQKVKTAHDCGALFRRMGYTHLENIWVKAVQ